jgi:hypothetical protein
MADAIKVLGQLDVSATTITTLYTVPDYNENSSYRNVSRTKRRSKSLF